MPYGNRLNRICRLVRRTLKVGVLPQLITVDHKMRAMREILTLSGQFLFLVSIFPNAFILPYPAVPMTRGDLQARRRNGRLQGF